MTLTLPTPQVPMPKRSILADLTDLLTADATGKPQEAREALAPSHPPPQPAEAPSRPAPGRQRLKLSPAQTVQALTNGRTVVREARLYAEAWYQALREWHSESRTESLPRNLAPKVPPKRQMTPVVGNWGAGDVDLSSRQVWTPMGWASEVALARAISREAGVLERVRVGGGLNSLVDERGGWARHGDRARGYALAVLDLAVALGDDKARQHRQALEQYAKSLKSASIPVELPE